MISNMIKQIKYFHLKLIHEHPKGINKRFENTTDKWVQSLRHPHIKTYHDYFHNEEQKKHHIKIHLTQKQQSYKRQVQSSLKPGVAQITEWCRFYFPSRPDDNQLSRDINDMTIGKFIKEGRQNYTDIHRLVVTGIIFIAVHIALYFIFFYGKQIPKSERVKVLNAQILESYHYQFQQMVYQKIKQRIKMVNEQYQKQLKQSKGL